MNDMLTEDDIWDILRDYMNTCGPVYHQLQSYNDFITFGLQNIIDQEACIVLSHSSELKYTAKFGQVTLSPPQIMQSDRSLKMLYPEEARKLNLTYDAGIYCDITEIFEEGEKKTVVEHPHILIGRLPIMVKSRACNLFRANTDLLLREQECLYDQGGYFIIKGKERVLVGQIRHVYNKIFVSHKDCEKFPYIAETRSMSVETGHSILIKALLSHNNREVYFSLPYIKEPILAGVVFKAMGFGNDEDIRSLLSFPKDAEKYVKFIIRDSYIVNTQEDALKYIGKHSLHIIPEESQAKYAWQAVETELFPHLGVISTMKEKACFLGYMIKKLIMTAIGKESFADLDNYTNKRIEVAGILIYDLFRNLYKRYINEIKKDMGKKKQYPDIITTISRQKGSITKGLHTAFGTGNWVASRATFVKSGVSQVLDRMTYASSLSHLRRLSIVNGKDSKKVDMRQIHSSQFGYIDPFETPEGKGAAGVVLNLALLTRVSRGVQPVLVKEILEENGEFKVIDDINLGELGKLPYVFLNGSLIGVTTDPINLTKFIRKIRRGGRVSSEISVVWDDIDNEIRIYCDEGRLLRPLCRVEGNKLLLDEWKRKGRELKWKTLIKYGIVEYVDCSEMEHSVVAMFPHDLETNNEMNVVYDYCEIHPSVMMGVISGSIPFPERSPAPRNSFQANMGKQSMGIPLLTCNNRADNLLYVMHYPQRPLVTTKISDILNMNEMPCVANPIVAIATYSG